MAPYSAPKAAPTPSYPKGRGSSTRNNLNPGAAKPPSINPGVTAAGSHGKATQNLGKSGKAAAQAAAKAHATKIVGGAPAGDVVGSDRWLADLTPAQVVKQARSTINASYKASFGDLNSEGKQLAAINAKRAQDNEVYQNWAAGQEQSILAAGTASDANFSAALASANTALAGAAPSSAALVAQANATQGNVSNNAMSNQIGAGGTVDQNTGKVNAQNAIGSTLDLSNVKDSGDLLRSDALNANARIGDNEAGQAATAQTQLTNLATQRSQLQLSKAGDIAKEIARLQGVEIQKSQAAQQYALAQQTLGNTAANDAAQAQNAHAAIVAGVVKSKIQAKEYFAGLNSRQAIAKYEQLNENQRAKLASETSLTENQQRAALSNKEYLLNVQKVGAEKAATIWKEQHPNSGSSSAHSSNPGGSPETANEQNEMFTKINTTIAQLNAAFTHFPTGKGGVAGGDHTIYQAFATGGGYDYVPAGQTTPTHVSTPALDPAILNAAFTLSKFRNSELTAGEVAKLRALGLRNVTSRLG